MCKGTCEEMSDCTHASFNQRRKNRSFLFFLSFSFSLFLSFFLFLSLSFFLSFSFFLPSFLFPLFLFSSFFLFPLFPLSRLSLSFFLFSLLSSLFFSLHFSSMNTYLSSPDSGRSQVPRSHLAVASQVARGCSLGGSDFSWD